MKHFINFFKGIGIGIATLVPGVSGGTMAIILGIYDEMIHAVSNFFKKIEDNVKFLFLIGLGAITGLVLFSKIIEYFMSNYKFIMMYLFMGIVIAGIPVLFKKANTEIKNKKDYIYLVIGFLIIFLMTLNVGTIVNLSNNTGILSFLFLIVAGIVIAIALILPGISTSFMLLTLGLYEKTISAINNLDINYLIPICIGGLIGVLGTTKILERFMNEHPRKTYFIILGFVLGSLLEIFPGIPEGINILYCIISFIFGYVIIRYISKKYGE
ncbi:MAG TPA: DUF368 domain-containing protein [Tenericutes bacterium]|nr:DUF368 domain-containing protein [Mycoplasmatota bacterium]